jgi:5'-methylthioadenosine phosphorylase
MRPSEKIKLGVIGGSGLYKIEGLEDIEFIDLDTPFGTPSTPVTVGTLEGLQVGFIARHGKNHAIAPTEVNYRANIYVLKALGAEKVLGISACGSLREDYSPGELAIADQLVDFTKKRESTFFGDGVIAHIGVADPFCQSFSEQVFSASKETQGTVKMGGTAVTIEGPRFSTRAESQLYRRWGIDLISMTTATEAFLAREAELCYTTLYHITDYDVWHKSEDPVSVEQVFEIIRQNTDHAKDIVRKVARNYTPGCNGECSEALKDAIVTQLDSAPAEKI